MQERKSKCQRQLRWNNQHLFSAEFRCDEQKQIIRNHINFFFRIEQHFSLYLKKEKNICTFACVL